MSRESSQVAPASAQSITNGKRTICVLPSGEMLKLKPVSHWLTRFKDYSRRTAGEVALPAVGSLGPLFDSIVHPPPSVHSPDNLLPSWISSARKDLGKGGKIWGIVLTEGGFLDNEALWLRDQYGETLPQLCIVNEISQQILMDLIDEVLGLGADGIVLDITDAYPNSGSVNFEGITAHCFCSYCLDGLRRHGFSESSDAFIGSRSILRPILKLTETGAEHLDAAQAWIDNARTEELLSLALARRFVEEVEEGDRDRLEKDAARILRYLKARVDLTSEAVHAILERCRSAGKDVAVILGSEDADLSQMTTLQSLQRAQAAKEYWLPDASIVSSKDLDNSPAIQFLAARSTYYFNAFFEVIEKANDTVVESGVEDFLSRVLSTSKRLSGNKLGAGAAYAVEKLARYDEMAGVPIGQEDHRELIERLTEEVTGTILPNELLDRFRIMSPGRAT